MQPQLNNPSQGDADRSSLVGIVLITVLMGVWLMWMTPQQETEEADRSSSMEEVDAVEQEAEADVEEEVLGTQDEETLLRAPTDTLFAASESPGRSIEVATDRLRATFSTKGATLTSLTLNDYHLAERSDEPEQGEEPVELVSNRENGALGLQFTPLGGGFVDSRVLSFEPFVDGEPFDGEILEVGNGERELTFVSPIGEGELRLIYHFGHDSYDVDLEVQTPGSDVFQGAGGYEIMWDGAIPFAEARPKDDLDQSGAYVRSGGETDKIRLKEEGEAEPILRSGAIDWVAVKNKFFISAIIPAEGVQTEGAELDGRQVGEEGNGAPFEQVYEARVGMPAPDEGQSDVFTLYLGPLELQRLSKFGLYDTVEFGFGGFMTRPISQFLIAPAFSLLGGFLPNYGLVIIVFGLLVKLILWPFMASSYRSMAKMRKLAPKMEEIKEKYGDDPQKQQKAMMKMYKEEGANPLGGCLPMLIQYPILIAMWRFFQNTLVLRQESFLWAADLSAPDPILHLPFSIPLYGDFVAGFTLLMGVSMLIQMRVSMASASTSNSQQKMFMYLMPVMFFFIFNRFPSGLSLYYLAFNLLSIVQQRIINKQVLEGDDDEETSEGSKKSKKAGGKVPSNGQANKRKRAKAR